MILENGELIVAMLMKEFGETTLYIDNFDWEDDILCKITYDGNNTVFSYQHKGNYLTFWDDKNLPIKTKWKSNFENLLYKIDEVIS